MHISESTIKLFTWGTEKMSSVRWLFNFNELHQSLFCRSKQNSLHLLPQKRRHHWREGGEESERPKNSNGKKRDQREREKLKRKEWDIPPKILWHWRTLESSSGGRGGKWWCSSCSDLLKACRVCGLVLCEISSYSTDKCAHTHSPLWIGMVWWCMLIFDWSAVFIPTCPGGSE